MTTPAASVKYTCACCGEVVIVLSNEVKRVCDCPEDTSVLADIQGTVNSSGGVEVREGV